MDSKIRDFIYRNVGYAAVIFACGTYLATSFINIDKTEKSIWEILIDGAIVFILSFFINRVFDLQGIINGERSEIYQDTMRLHGQAVLKVSPVLDQLDEWCEKKNAENLRLQRTRILASEGLRYDDYFEADGTVKEGVFFDPDTVNSRNVKRLYRKRNECIEKAIRVKLTPLSAGELTSEGAKGNDPYDFGRTKLKYEMQTSAYDACSKIAIAIVFGYYGVSMLESFSYADLIWHVFQVGLFAGVGTVSMYNSYNFIRGEHRGRIVKKINCLEMFFGQMKKQVEPETATTKETEVNENEQHI